MAPLPSWSRTMFGVRRRLGVGDPLRNHLHMPADPGDTRIHDKNVTRPDKAGTLAARHDSPGPAGTCSPGRLPTPRHPFGQRPSRRCRAGLDRLRPGAAGVSPFPDRPQDEHRARSTPATACPGAAPAGVVDPSTGDLASCLSTTRRARQTGGTTTSETRPSTVAEPASLQARPTGPVAGLTRALLRDRRPDDGLQYADLRRVLGGADLGR